MPKYRDWDCGDDDRARKKKEPVRRRYTDDYQDYWDRKGENRQKWNKKHPGRK